MAKSKAHSDVPLREVISELLRDLRDSSGRTQLDILRELGWAEGDSDKDKRKRKSTLSRIENAGFRDTGIPWAEINNVAKAYGADPLALLIVQALSEVEEGDPFKIGSTEGRGGEHFTPLLQKALSILGCESRDHLKERLIAPRQRKVKSVYENIRQHTLASPLIQPWSSEVTSQILPEPRFAGIAGDYREMSFDETFNKTAEPIVLHGTRGEGVGFAIAVLLRQLERHVIIVDAARYLSSTENVADAIADEILTEGSGVRNWLRDVVTEHPERTSVEGSALWLVYDHCEMALEQIDNCDFLKARREPGAANLRHVLVFDRSANFEDIERCVPDALHVAMVPLRSDEAIEIARPRILPKCPTFSDANISQSYGLLLRRHLWLLQLIRLIDEHAHAASSEAFLPSIETLSFEVQTAILSAERSQETANPRLGEIQQAAQTRTLDALSSNDQVIESFLRDSLGIPDGVVASTPTSWMPKRPDQESQRDKSDGWTVIVENVSAGQALAALVNAESASSFRGERPEVVLAPYQRVLNPRELRPDVAIIQHYSQFRELCKKGKVSPLVNPARSTLNALHSPLARSLCQSEDGEWWGVPFHYPTKIACYREEHFPDGLPSSVSELMQSLQGGKKLLLQLQQGHPSLYYEWLAFVYALGGADAYFDPLHGIRVAIDTEETIRATEIFLNLCDPQFSHKNSRGTDWYSVYETLATDPSVALAFPFNDGIPEVLLPRSRRPESASSDKLNWAPFRMNSMRSKEHASQRIFGSRAAPMHVTTVHVVACVNGASQKFSSEFADWLMHREFQEGFALRTVESPFAGTNVLPDPKFPDASHEAAWRAASLAQQYLAPVIPPGPWDSFSAGEDGGLLNDGQSKVLHYIERMVHHGDKVRESLKEAGNELRTLFSTTHNISK